MIRSLCKCICLLFPGLLIMGCQAISASGGYYSNPLRPGAEITVKRELQVPPGYARVYYQYGNAMSYAAVNQYAPFCYFLMNQPRPEAQIIRPGIFRVIRVSLMETEVRRSLPVRLAARGFFADDGGRGPIAYQSHMSLSASHQDDVRALVCSGAFESPPEARPIRLPEVQQALGDAVSVREVPAPGYGQ